MDTSFAGRGFGGTVRTGGSPLAHAQVQLYAAGAAGSGSAPTQLLAAAISTDTAGGFQVAAGTYTCPSPTAMLYVVSTGGQVAGQQVNEAIAFLTVAGPCNGITEGANLTVNEVTTVGAVFALRPFLAAGAQLGSTATNTGGLGLGLGAFQSLVNPATGTAPGPNLPANGNAPVAKLNTLANLLYGCAASAGSSSAGCTQLFSLLAGSGRMPTDTLDAALQIANQPSGAVAGLFGLAAAKAFYSPTLPSAPPTGPWRLRTAGVV